MPFNSKARSELALKRPRDANGHFISPNQTIKATSKSSGAGNILTKFFRAEKDSQDDEAIVNIRVNNPLHRITKLLEDIRRKQATTFSMRFTIPLVALPVAIFIAFQVGRFQINCLKSNTSVIGELRNVVVTKEIPIVNIPYFTNWLNLKQKVTEPQAIILNNNNEAITILNQTNLSLTQFEKKKLILTGDYSSCNKTLTLTHPQNLSGF